MICLTSSDSVGTENYGLPKKRPRATWSDRLTVREEDIAALQITAGYERGTANISTTFVARRLKPEDVKCYSTVFVEMDAIQ